MCKPFLLLVLFLLLLFLADIIFNDRSSQQSDGWSDLLDNSPNNEISQDLVRKVKTINSNINCHFASECLDVYKCGNGKLKVYIYPPEKYFYRGENVLEMSEEMYEILETVYNSPHYTSDPSRACLFLPSVDLLNTRNVDPKLIAAILYSLPHWNRGRNHLILNIVNGDHVLPTDNAVLVTPQPHKPRLGYDLTIPVLSNIKFKHHQDVPRKYLLSYPDMKESKYPQMFSHLSSDLVTSFSVSRMAEYKRILSQSTFCLVPLPSALVTLLTDCLSAGAIPVLLTPSPPSLPFSQLIDWTQVSVQFRPNSLTTLVPILQSYSKQFVQGLQSKVKEVYSQHFQSPSAMTRSLFNILERTQQVSEHQVTLSSLPAADLGFTAVILTYDRVQSLYQVITTISQVESLVRILVIWNHQGKSPPPADDWPRISKPLKVIQTSANKLSNRFHPYKEIDTECVLSLDDDISMLTVDELEFAYQVWRQFPDRIVGFPPRTHVFDNVTGHYKYESEWVNDLSLVLTGVAFYHKYWHYLYTASPSQQQRQIKEWVDSHINCEDIAFNLMVANATAKAPVKVGPRKKFKCSTASCDNAGMLSASASHLEERSSCLDKFVSIYGHNPLTKVQFRADPVLYKENLPDDIKMFKDIGSL